MPRIVSGCHEMLRPSLTYAKAHYPINCTLHLSALALVQLVCVMHHLRGLMFIGGDPIRQVLTVLLARRECCVFRWFCVCCLGMEWRSCTSLRSNVYIMALVATFNHSSTKRFVSLKTFRFKTRLKCWHCFRPFGQNAVKTSCYRSMPFNWPICPAHRPCMALPGKSSQKCIVTCISSTVKRVWGCCDVSVV
jgi:hypothetical protein